MNLSEGRRHHRQRLIPAEGEKAPRHTMLKFTTQTGFIEKARLHLSVHLPLRGVRASQQQVAIISINKRHADSFLKKQTQGGSELFHCWDWLSA